MVHSRLRLAYEKAPRGQDVEHADGVTLEVRPGGECGEDHEDDGRDEKRVGARPVVGKPAKGQLADDGAGESDVTDVLLGIGGLVEVAILKRKDGGDGPNNLLGWCQSEGGRER